MDGDANRRMASVIALFLILVGLTLIYFWPKDSKYVQTSIESAKISKEGLWVVIEGDVLNITKKTNGETLQICTEKSACISIYFEGESGLYYLKGRRITARGEISAVSGNRFLRGHEFELVR